MFKGWPRCFNSQRLRPLQGRWLFQTWQTDLPFSFSSCLTVPWPPPRPPPRPPGPPHTPLPSTWPSPSPYWRAESEHPLLARAVRTKSFGSVKSSGGILSAAFSALQLKTLAAISYRFVWNIRNTHLSNISLKKDTCLGPRCAKLCQCTTDLIRTFGSKSSGCRWE